MFFEFALFFSGEMVTHSCDLDLKNDDLHTFFIDNQQTTGHQSVIFGMRELTANESRVLCRNASAIVDPPIFDEPFNFTANYKLRTYLSGCYYLDDNKQWQCDGLKVGPLTNLRQTQCFSSFV